MVRGGRGDLDSGRDHGGCSRRAGVAIAEEQYLRVYVGRGKDCGGRKDRVVVVAMRKVEVAVREVREAVRVRERGISGMELSSRTNRCL